MATRAQPAPIAPARMCPRKPSTSPKPSPTLPTTEARLRCANKRRLYRALKQADLKIVSDWLLSSQQQTFHHRTPIPSAAFDNALAIHATHATSPPSTGPGSDMLLVPVVFHQGKLLGYSFGGISKRPVDGNGSCPYGGMSRPIFPHFVGRFSFDISSGDFLAVIHGIAQDVIGVLHIRNDGDNRERSMFVVGAGSGGHQRLPDRLLSLVTGTERRRSATPKYQFSVGGGSDRSMNDALTKMERVLKGYFTCSRQRKDDMDPSNGEVLNRFTMSTDAKFDVMDAVGLQKARDQAVRIYYSYMSRMSGGSSSKQRS